jgi:hypothetical protein
VRRADGEVDASWEDTVYAALDPGSSFESVGGAAAVARRGRASFGELVLRLRQPVPAVAGPTRMRVSARGLDAATVVELPASQPASLEIVGATVNGQHVRPDSARASASFGSGDSLGRVAPLPALVNEETIVLGYTPTW